MPASPDDGARYAREVTALIDDAENALLRLLAQHLGADPESATWAADRMAELETIRARATRGMRSLDADLERAITRVVMRAYHTGAALALPDLDTLDVTITPGGLAAATVTEQLAALTLTQTRTALASVPRILSAAYTQAVSAGALEVLSGGNTRLQAAQHVLDRLLADGVRGFTDKAGRNWSLDTYVEMAVRTTTGQAAVQGHVDQLQAAGVDLVVVSDAPRECPLCRRWEGKVLSTSGRVGAVIEPSVTGDEAVTVTIAGTLEQARAAGFQHSNCRHSVSAYLPGATRLDAPEHDPAGYDAAQRQRAMERHVRSWKRRENIALTPEAGAQARAKVRAWQGALREHVDVNDLKRLRAREQVGTPGTPLAH